MWIYYNSNPMSKTVGDCAIRALSKTLDVDWETAYLLATNAGFNMCDMPSFNSVWGAESEDNTMRCSNPCVWMKHFKRFL